MIFTIFNNNYRDIVNSTNEFEAICDLLSRPPLYSNFSHYLVKPQVKYKDIDRITGLWDTDRENILGNGQLVFIEKPTVMAKDLNTIITPHMRRVTLEHNRQMAEMVRTRLDLKGINPGSPDPIYSKTQYTHKQIKENERFVKAVDSFIGKING
jgi:hypothetical protein